MINDYKTLKSTWAMQNAQLQNKICHIKMAIASLLIQTCFNLEIYKTIAPVE
jgi:hypothetical protein